MINSKKVALWGLSVSIVLLMLLTLITSPQKAGPRGVMLWFGLFFIGVFCTALLIQKYFYRTIKKTTSLVYADSVIISLLVTSLLALSSLGQLQLRDFVLVVSGTLLLRWYLKLNYRAKNEY